jgi:hypothetical protein
MLRSENLGTYAVLHIGVHGNVSKEGKSLSIWKIEGVIPCKKKRADVFWVDENWFFFSMSTEIATEHLSHSHEVKKS